MSSGVFIARPSLSFDYVVHLRGGSAERQHDELDSNEIELDASEMVKQSNVSHRDAVGTNDDFYLNEGCVCSLYGNGRVIVLPAMFGIG